MGAKACKGISKTSKEGREVNVTRGCESTNEAAFSDAPQKCVKYLLERTSTCRPGGDYFSGKRTRERLGANTSRECNRYENKMTDNGVDNGPGEMAGGERVDATEKEEETALNTMYLKFGPRPPVGRSSASEGRRSSFSSASILSLIHI